MSMPIAAIERVSKKAGVNRISGKSLRELQKVIDEISLELARDAAEYARHAHRKTILAEDIKLAAGKG